MLDNVHTTGHRTLLEHRCWLPRMQWNCQFPIPLHQIHQFESHPGNPHPLLLPHQIHHCILFFDFLQIPDQILFPLRTLSVRTLSIQVQIEFHKWHLVNVKWQMNVPSSFQSVFLIPHYIQNPCILCLILEETTRHILLSLCFMAMLSVKFPQLKKKKNWFNSAMGPQKIVKFLPPKKNSRMGPQKNCIFKELKPWEFGSRLEQQPPTFFISA
jgi:hypothetical protein